MTEPINLFEPLNERELEIIPLLSGGLSNKEIADRLFLAPSTVKWYIRQLNQKLDTGNRHEIVERVQELGLLGSESQKKSYFRPRENLPRQTTSFIGRDAELDEIHQIIEKEEVRLLTILAPGGMGKTRIALEATEQQSNRYPDGVYFVPLQALSELEQIIPQIASSTFFTSHSGDRSEKQQVLDFLSNKRMLLCIDNWEHLLDGALLLNEILAVAPEVKIIATSREKLNLLAETVYVLEGMEFPEWKTPDDALRYDAVQLLLQSAQRAKPDWTITEENLDFVAQVCRLTQGMPLGILLASSWLDIYSLERICEEIQKSADILETDMRDVPERQRSIRAVFDYSWQGLKPNEQTVLMKMSVFRGGCSPEASEAVAGANPRILQSLVNKALLLRNREGRYDIHELLRQYAEERLQQSNVLKITQQVHIQYYANALSGYEEQLKDYRQLEALASIEIDFENMRSAWKRALQEKLDTIINQMLVGLTLYSHLHHSIAICIDLFNDARDCFANNLNDDSRFIWGRLLSRCYDSNEEGIFGQLETALVIARDYHDEGEEAHCLHEIGSVYAHFTTDYEHALEYLNKAHDKYHQLGHLYEMSQVLVDIAWCYIVSGKAQIARNNIKQSIELKQTMGDELGLASALEIMGATFYLKGAYDKAQENFQDAIRILQKTHNLDGIAYLKTLLAEIGFLQGHLDRSEQLQREALNLVIPSSTPHIQAHMLHVSSLIESMNDAYEKAKSLAEESLALSAVQFLRNDAEWSLSLAACGLEDYDNANLHNSHNLAYALSANSLPMMTWFLPVSAIICNYQGNTVQAVELLGLVYSHPASATGWLEKWSFMSNFIDMTETKLGSANFNLAWDRGKSLDLEATIRGLLNEFGSET